MPPEPCCDLHGRNCEPPSELCCEDCTEIRHGGWTDDRGNWRFGHPRGETCSSPVLSLPSARGLTILKTAAEGGDSIEPPPPGTYLIES